MEYGVLYSIFAMHFMKKKYFFFIKQTISHRNSKISNKIWWDSPEFILNRKKKPKKKNISLTSRIIIVLSVKIRSQLPEFIKYRNWDKDQQNTEERYRQPTQSNINSHNVMQNQQYCSSKKYNATPKINWKWTE